MSDDVRLDLLKEPLPKEKDNGIIGGVIAGVAALGAGGYCPYCGISIDRDLNASLNIRNIGINTVGHTGINACGDGSLEPSLKQEKECLEN